MITRRLGPLFVLGLIVAAWPHPAVAQSFVPAGAWQPLPCGLAPMFDPLRDQPGAVGERDIVGDQAAPAGFIAWDPTFLYLRMRLDGTEATAFKPFFWGFELSLDANHSTYELLIGVNGVSGTVEVYRNTATTRPNDPSDPPDQPAVLSYPVSSHARLEAASPASSFGGSADTFVTLAVPWSALAAFNLRPTTPAVIIAGTSSTATKALDGDLACHDGSTGAAALDEIGGGVPVVADVAADTDGDKYPDWYEVRYGSDPAVATSHPDGPPPGPGVTPGSFASRIEGGGGCRVTGEDAGGAGAVLLLALGLALLARRR